MTGENDVILSKLTVRFKDSDTLNVIGTGIIYYNQNLKDKIYIITAAHNLYKDPDSFKVPIEQVIIDVFNSATNSYQSLFHTINYNLVYPEIDRDIAVLLFDLNEIAAITDEIPFIWSINERLTTSTFTLKGFPKATQGEELACINPVWVQKMTGTNKFQLQLTEDYSGWATNGFSGSGVFLIANNQIYLYGVFTRFREEGKGKVIYCQYIETVNEILTKNYLPLLSFTFFGEHGLTSIFFEQQVLTALNNLGPRFNEKLNFRLPIARLFNDLAKDNIFKRRLLKAIDNWLLTSNHNVIKGDKKLIDEIETDFNSIKKTVIDWLPTISWDADQKFELQEIFIKINSLNEKIENKIHDLFDLQRIEENKNLEKKRDYSYQPPFEVEINRLRNIREFNYNFFNELDYVNISLANNPCLIIKGDAGCGKSHLLGDIANERANNHQPTILLLGQLFQKGQSVWQNILSQLNLICTKEELLFSLNSIGRQLSSRVLILIDALNEGAGKQLWPNELAGFIGELSQYPFIGLALTVRSTYYNVIVPVSVQHNKGLTHLIHEGFKGSEYEALRLFCEHYGLKQPNFPILSPEFSNPLFLQLICEGVKNSGQDKFPQGFQGIDKIFELYLNAISSKLTNKREEYLLRKNIIKNAIYEMAKACFENVSSMSLTIDNANQLFDEKFPEFRYLLSDLIFENVFIQSILQDYKTDTNIEVVYFAYERFGDFYISKELLKPYKSEVTVRKAFQNHNVLGKLLEDVYWRNRGILEAMAILLPEKWNLELVEVYGWVFKGEHDNLRGDVTSNLNYFLIESLKFRTIESINNDKLTKWLNSDKNNIDFDNYINILIELTAQKDHPFNGDRLYKILMQYSMPKRDAFWQKHVRNYSAKDDYENAYPIRRLIDWAWQQNISDQIDQETARLTGQTLAWVLSSTYIKLRDQTTKAMVNLLQEQPEALLNILEAFKGIDDYYILERLYGVTYGCALRTSKEESLCKIAQYVFDAIFKEGKPPKHILIRDYARNIIEFAIFKEILLEGDLKLIKPPYSSKIPSCFPSDEEMKRYQIDYKSPDYKQRYGHNYNQIAHSVMSWDFGRYVIDSALRDFSPISFTMENEYTVFLKGLPTKQRKAVKFFEFCTEQKILYIQRKKTVISSIGQEKYDYLVNDIDEYLSEILQTLNSELSEEDHLFFTNKVIPHIKTKQLIKDWQHNLFNTDPFKRWIVQRSFELGYNAEMHGQYESSIESYNEHSEYKIERIGKKYQWIALYEIIAMVADNYHIDKDRRSNKTKNKYYQGAWQGYLRNIDPVFITRKLKKEDETDFEIENSYHESKWWIDYKYDYWNEPDSIWASTSQDLPDPKLLILRKDESGQEWLYLKTHIDWEEPKPIGEDKYRRDRKEIWYQIQGYLIHKKDKKKIVNWLQHQNYKGQRLPENHRANLSLFNRENYWSPASKENEKEIWDYIEDTDYKVMVSTSEAVGELSHDKSGAHFRYNMPCKMIFEGMNLQYAPIDGELKDKEGEIVVINPDDSGILIRKNNFLQFLFEKKLEVIWTIIGEKNVLKGNFPNNNGYYKEIYGIYSLENNTISGFLKLSNRD